MSTHNICLLRNKKNIMWIPPLICSYVLETHSNGPDKAVDLFNNLNMYTQHMFKNAFFPVIYT